MKSGGALCVMRQRVSSVQPSELATGLIERPRRAVSGLTLRRTVQVNASQPTVLLVPGAWHGAWMWASVVRELAAREWPVQTVDLPSTGDRTGPRAGLYKDAEVVRRRINEIGGPVVVVGHSYGGAVVSEAAGLSNVQHIVNVCGFQLDIGESLLSSIGGNVPPFWTIDDDVITLNGARELLYYDVPPEVANRAIQQLKPLSWIAVTEPLTAAAWRTVPSTYIMCDRDTSSPTGQEFFAARATMVRHLPSSHSPHASMPSALTDLIVEAAGASTDGDQSNSG